MRRQGLLNVALQEYGVEESEKLRNERGGRGEKKKNSSKVQEQEQQLKDQEQREAEQEARRNFN